MLHPRLIKQGQSLAFTRLRGSKNSYYNMRPCMAGNMESAHPALASGENNVLPVLAGNVPVALTLRVHAAPPLRGPVAPTPTALEAGPSAH
jgi:hypothetical protein